MGITPGPDTYRRERHFIDTPYVQYIKSNRPPAKYGHVKDGIEKCDGNVAESSARI